MFINFRKLAYNYAGQSGCWSMVGTDAIGKSVTMVLNLGGTPEGYPSPDLQRSLVIHEFGHALGLMHNHQCSDFWDILEKHIDTEKMKSDSYLRGAYAGNCESVAVTFESQWKKQVEGASSNSAYDPNSIMHYR